jgi:hypothetical protein
MRFDRQFHRRFCREARRRRCQRPHQDTTVSEDAATSRTGSGPANLAAIRAAAITAVKDVGYLQVPEGRRDHPPPPKLLHLHGPDQGRYGHSRHTPEPWEPGHRPRPSA